MKKHTLLTIFFSVSTLFSCHAATPQESSIAQSIDLTQQNITQKKDWARVTARFKREEFLKDCDNEHKTEYTKLIAINPKNEEKLNETCWNALFKLKDLYKPNEDRSNYTFTYQSMAKFLLTYNTFPKKCNTQKKQNEFLNNLINKIGQGITPRLAPTKHQKIKRWFHIYEGMLFLKYATMFAKEDRRERHIANAYHEFSKAIELKTTKTTYLLAAEAILDYNHTPAGMTRKEAEDLAYRYIEIAETKEERHISKKSENVQEKEKLTTVEVHAKPTYMIELNWLTPITPNNTSSENQIINVIPNDFLVTQDNLENYNYTQLIIPRRVNADDLPVRNNPMNRIGEAQEIYHIDGKILRRQNVAGTNMRCFFNAAGLNAENQMIQLVFLANDPILRYMIANEIVSAARDPDQIPTQVQQAINYDLYRTEQNTLDELEQIRNILLLEQSPIEHFQNIALLPPEYQNLQQRGEELLEQLRTRALSLNAYNTFIQHHIGNEEMMVTLLDLQNNNNANFTSIDAIAYINNIGIKIYRPTGNQNLICVHEYIPQDATEIAYIYHQGIHFQSLIPVEDDNANTNNNEINENQTVIETGFLSNLQLPNTEELIKIYPEVTTLIEHHHYEENFVRKILYMREHLNKKQKEIALNFNINSRRISEILNKHNIRELHYISNETKEKLLQAYLESYKNIENKKTLKINFYKALVIKLNKIMTEKQFEHAYTRLFEKQVLTDSIEEKEKNKIVKLYLQGKSFFSIQEKTSINLLTIISILSEKLNPKDYKNPINLELKKELLSKQQKEDLIIKTFNKLKENDNQNPSILTVQKLLKEYEIGYKTCERVLKTNNLIPQNIKSQHIPIEIQNKIKLEFNKLNPPKGKIQETYKALAKKYNTSKGQITDLIKDRTFESERKKEIQENYTKVVKAYHNLTVEEKKKPLLPIQKIVPLARSAISKHLQKAGLYKANGMHGKSTINILANNKHSNKRKAESEIEINIHVKKKMKKD